MLTLCMFILSTSSPFVVFLSTWSASWLMHEIFFLLAGFTLIDWTSCNLRISHDNFFVSSFIVFLITWSASRQMHENFLFCLLFSHLLTEFLATYGYFEINSFIYCLVVFLITRYASQQMDGNFLSCAVFIFADRISCYFRIFQDKFFCLLSYSILDYLVCFSANSWKLSLLFVVSTRWQNFLLMIFLDKFLYLLSYGILVCLTNAWK